MRLIALELENFRQYAQASLRFETGITAIVGANGAGKSTLVEAILWALYGSTAIRGTVDTLRFLWSEGGTKVRATLEFELGTRRYQIQRTQNDAWIALLGSSGWQRLASGTSAVNRFVQQLLGMNFQQFQTSFCARQKELEFMHYAPERRREEISKMLGYDRVRTALESATQTTRALQSEVDGLKQGIGDPQQVEAEIKTLGTHLQTVETALQEKEAELKTARQALEHARQRFETESAKRIAHQTLLSALQHLQAQYEHLERLMEEYRTRWQELKTAEARLKELRSQIERYRELQKRLAELDKLAESEHQRTQLLASLQHLTQQMAQLQEQIAELLQKQSEREQLEPKVQEYLRLDEEARTLRQIAQQAQQRAKLTTQCESLQQQLQQLREIEDQYAKRQSQLQQIQREEQRLIREQEAQQQEVQRLTNAWQEERTQAEADLRAHTAQCHELKARVEQLQRLGAETECPTCGQPLGDAYQRVLKQANDTYEQAKQRYRELKARAQSLAVEPQDLQHTRQQLEQLQVQLEANRQERIRAEHELHTLQEQLREKARLEQAIQDLQRQIDAIPSYDPEYARTVEAQLDALRPDYQHAQALEVELRRLNPLQRDYNAKQREEERLQQQLSQLPTGYDPSEHAQVREAWHQLRPLYEEALALQTTLKGKEELKQKIESAKQELEQNRLEQAERNRQITELGYDEAVYQASEEAYQQADAQVRTLESQHADLRAQREGLIGRIEALQNQLEQIRQRQLQLQQKQRELLMHQTLRKALQEFRTELNTRLQPLLTDYATEFLASLTGGRYTQLEIDEEFRFQIIDEGMRKAVISGGEQDVVNLSLRLALARLITERAGQSLSLLILDEVFGSLDTDRRRNVLDVLNNLRDWFEQILVISHIEEINESADRCLYVVRDERTRRSQVLERLPSEELLSAVVATEPAPQARLDL